MQRRFMSIWFRYLSTDYYSIRKPALRDNAFVLTVSSHGRMVVTAANALAEKEGIFPGIALADARAIVPHVQVKDDQPQLINKLLTKIAEWCIRFTPVAAVDEPDGIVLDISGCAHLWGGEAAYLNDIIKRLNHRGYTVRAAIADTVGAAWAIARFGKKPMIINPNEHSQAMLCLPNVALRLEVASIDRLNKLGLRSIKDFISMPRSALRRRFGDQVITRLNQALGYEEEILQPVFPLAIFQERLPCLDPIVTAKGIEMAVERLLYTLCTRLANEQKGLRVAVLKCFRVDGKTQELKISTSSASNHVKHLFKLFEINLGMIEPDLGIELFIMDAPIVQDHFPVQQNFWESANSVDDIHLTELVDRLAGRLGADSIHRFLPAEHYWPERSFKKAGSLQEEKTTDWNLRRPRPMQLLSRPERIDVTAPVPDYPPMLFRYKGKLHKIIKADGPERIEQEWWIEEGQHRDYYAAEDEDGHRYWLFRSGHYDDDTSKCQWFIHGFFA